MLPSGCQPCADQPGLSRFSVSSQARGECGPLAAVSGPPSGYSVCVAAPTDGMSNLERGGQDLEEKSLMPLQVPHRGLACASRVQLVGCQVSKAEDKMVDGEEHSPMRRLWADQVDSASTSRARGEYGPVSPVSSSPSVHSEHLELPAGEISNLEIRGQWCRMPLKWHPPGSKLPIALLFFCFCSFIENQRRRRTAHTTRPFFYLGTGPGQGCPPGSFEVTLGASHISRFHCEHSHTL